VVSKILFIANEMYRINDELMMDDAVRERQRLSRFLLVGVVVNMILIFMLLAVIAVLIWKTWSLTNV
jgi:hypothetical protein